VTPDYSPNSTQLTINEETPQHPCRQPNLGMSQQAVVRQTLQVLQVTANNNETLKIGTSHLGLNLHQLFLAIGSHQPINLAHPLNNYLMKSTKRNPFSRQ
jgi:hypothetical protein